MHGFGFRFGFFWFSFRVLIFSVGRRLATACCTEAGNDNDYDNKCYVIPCTCSKIEPLGYEVSGPQKDTMPLELNS